MIKTMNTTFTAACLQFNPLLGKQKENINALLKLTREAALAGATLIVTPEMATTGYHFEDREAVSKVVDTIPGETTRLFETIAKEFLCYIVVGMPEVEKETGLFYNSAALIGPDGYIGKYRKMHLWETEAHWAVPGDLGVPVYPTEIGNIAINICMDTVYFESSRLAALAGADLLAFPTNSSAQTISFLQERAEGNGMYIISANRSNSECGFEMVGGSAIWSPSGEKVAEAPFSHQMEDPNRSFLLFGTIDKTQYQNKSKDRMMERRPELYKELKLHIAPWNSRKTKVTNQVTLVAIQSIIQSKSNEERFNHYKQQIEREINQGDQQTSPVLVVLPELAINGPVDHLSTSKIEKIALNESEDIIQRYQQLAKDLSIHLVAGVVEKEGSYLYNTALLINDNGDINGKYRKTHLTPNDKRWAQQGETLPVFQCNNLGRIGILIGYDAAFPEAAGVLTVKRSDIVAIPSSWQGEFGCLLEREQETSDNGVYLTTWDSLSHCCQVYTVISNWNDPNREVNFRSGIYTLDAIYGSDQPLMASRDNDCVIKGIFSTLQLDSWFNQEKLVASRRIEHYSPIIRNSGNLAMLYREDQIEKDEIVRKAH